MTLTKTMAAIRPIVEYAHGLQYVGVGALVLYGFVVLAAQLLRFMRDGVWVPFSVATMLSRLELGISPNILVLDRIPTSAAFFGIAIVWVGVWKRCLAK
ncbi:hypothetical protein [Mesorhizobium sp. B2-4-8]|uniref:hypothetical protein n=1 Tax=Mesorhizobium sp. B2-4-8 TaxID=2589941 RepID=UPI00112E5B72|nr:hypothetical protein [Mesorhizobium sp. B2-4-8]TPL39244.1 hypothetical protein FJ947_00080 [Mesorhizobium sp. B2-4-8]